MPEPGDPLVEAWARRAEIKKGLFGLLGAVAIAAFLGGAWWWGVATKSWVREKIDVERKAAAKESEKIEGVKTDLRVIKFKLESVENANERTQDKVDQLYRDIGELPLIQRARRERKVRERQAMPPRRPGE